MKDEYKADIKQAVQNGDSIGLHSMSHDANKLYKQGQFIPEMEQESKLISDIVGKKSWADSRAIRQYLFKQ